MRGDRRGVSTVECLVALVLFVVGALGAVGTIALAIRMAAEGSHLAGGARLANGTLGQIRDAVEAAGHTCAAVSAGRVDAYGNEVAWSTEPDSGGRRVLLLVSYATSRGRHRDSVIGFVPCR
jgi:Tfp pilus assembly protein PilV